MDIVSGTIEVASSALNFKRPKLGSVCQVDEETKLSRRLFI